MRSKFFVTIITLVISFFTATTVASAQSAVELIILIDEDTLTIFVPGDQTVSLQDIALEIVLGDQRQTYGLAEFEAFRPIRFEQMPTPVCLRLEKELTNRVIPLECQSARLITQVLPTGNIFWYDDTNNQARTVVIMQGTNQIDFCAAGQTRCQLRYIPPTLSPNLPATATAPPALPPTVAIVPTAVPPTPLPIATEVPPSTATEFPPPVNLSPQPPALNLNSAVFYWISHGHPADPAWQFFLDGAEQWAADTGAEVRTSFHSGDASSHREAFRAAIGARPTGIVSSLPDRGTLDEVIAEAQAAGIPVILMSTEDRNSGRDAYVGLDSVEVGRRWAQYLVDNGYVQSGDFVWMPVEVPGANYQVLETEGIASVFDPLGINYEITDATLDQAEIIARMSNYLTANRGNIDAIIGLGDLVTGSIPRVFEQVGVAPGEIPVVGWGNSPETARGVLDGFITAAMWQDPQVISYVALSLAAQAATGAQTVEDVLVGTLYEADTAADYLRLMED